MKLCNIYIYIYIADLDDPAYCIEFYFIYFDLDS